jgi:hypothetical protein
MGAEFTDLTEEDMCDLMCGKIQEADDYGWKNPETEKDNINPSHYKDSCSIECIDVMEIAFGNDAVFKYCIINAFKYMWRYKNKNGLEDVRNAQWYIWRAEGIRNKSSLYLGEEWLDKLTKLSDMINGILDK